MIRRDIFSRTPSTLFIILFILAVSFYFTNIASAAPVQVVARTGQAAFDVSGHVYNGFYFDNSEQQVAIPAPKFAGELVAFFSSLKQGTVALPTNNGLWLMSQAGTSGRKLAKTGDQVDGLASGILHLLQTFYTDFGTSVDGRVSFTGYLSGPSIVAPVNSAALWMANPNNTSLVVQSGGVADEAPEILRTYYFRDFFEPKNLDNINAPDLAFRAMAPDTPGGSSPATYGTWVRDENQSIRKLARAVGLVPGITPNAFFATGGEIISKSGQRAVIASSIYGPAVTTIVAGGVSILTDQVLLAASLGNDDILIARKGSQAPGTADGVVFRELPSYTPNAAAMPAVGPDGEIVFSGVLAGPGVSSGNWTGLWKHTPQTGVNLLARGGSPATAVGPGVVLVELRANSTAGTLWIMDNADTVFAARIGGQGVTLLNAAVIYHIASNGDHSLLARSGVSSPALPTGVTLLTATLPLVMKAAGNDHVMFTAQLSGTGITTANNDVLLRHTNANGLQLVAQEGQEIDGYILKSFVSNGADLQLTDNYYAVVTGTFSPASNPGATPRPGILGISPDGIPHTLAVTTYPISLSDGTTPTFNSFRLASINAINNSGKVVFSARLSTTPRDEAVLVAQIEGATTPACEADFNSNGTVAVDDIFAYLSAWFAQNISADTNENGTVAVDDIFAFLSFWFVGC